VIKALVLAAVLAQGDAPVKGWRVSDTQACADAVTFEKHMAQDQKLEDAIAAQQTAPILWAIIGLIIGGVSTYAVVKAGGAK
jgi:hypothetical protein